MGESETQLSVSPKSPLAETPRKFRGKLAEFVTVIVCGALEFPSVTEPKARVAGDVATIGGSTVTGTMTSRLPPPGAYFTSTDVLPSFTAEIDPEESAATIVGSAEV
jgi:hypothetical protein